MGHILMTSDSFLRSASEDAGARSGIALNQADILKHLGNEHPFVEKLTSGEVLRLASDDYGDAVGDLLYALGASDTPGMPPLSHRFLLELPEEQRGLLKIMELVELSALASEFGRRRLAKSGGSDEVMDAIRSLLGKRTATLIDPLYIAIEKEIALNPFYVGVRKVQDQVALSDLFKKEKLPSHADNFFDQRFINYLARHPDLLSHINWRQFEGLTAEWFHREGYQVELGPGRNDGGVDVRLWKQDGDRQGPPAIIVQCKRHKGEIDKVTVKALYADLVHENVEQGMIVATSDLSPGAAKDIETRNYPITDVNRVNVVKWIAAMSKPGAGFI